MAFPPKYQDISLNDDLTMEEDFTLAEKVKDPYSRIKVDKFKSLYTERITSPTENTEAGVSPIQGFLVPDFENLEHTVFGEREFKGSQGRLLRIYFYL